jgi:hypothetical protein
MNEHPSEKRAPSHDDAKTINNRLFVAGLLHAFDEAKAAKDRPKMIELLMAVEYSKTDAEQIADTDRYAGLTTNERLFDAGLIDAYDRAAITKDRTKMIELLMAVEFSKADAEQIADAVLAYPRQYGY